jgi:hypothetical protein
VFAGDRVAPQDGRFESGDRSVELVQERDRQRVCDTLRLERCGALENRSRHGNQRPVVRLTRKLTADGGDRSVARDRTGGTANCPQLAEQCLTHVRGDDRVLACVLARGAVLRRLMADARHGVRHGREHASGQRQIRETILVPPAEVTHTREHPMSPHFVNVHRRFSLSFTGCYTLERCTARPGHNFACKSSLF